MGPVPEVLEMPYRVGRSWAEQQILAGRVVSRDRKLMVDLRVTNDSMRTRAEDVWRAIWFSRDSRAVFVHGTGIDASEAVVGDPREQDWPALNDPIVAKIGRVPELPEPVQDPEAVISAYEVWIRRYRDLSLGALATWVDNWATDEKDGIRGFQLDEGTWKQSITYRAAGAGQTKTVLVDGREHLELFQKVRAAVLHNDRVMVGIDNEDLLAAEDIVGAILEVDREPPLDALVERYADFQSRWDAVALAHHEARAKARRGFELEMRRWAEECGSERLCNGLQDGFRMTSIYLEERILSEVPGAYAHLPTQDEKWLQSRVSPTGLALKLRRAVQERLDETQREGDQAPRATIAWLRDIPDGLEREYDDRGSFVGRASSAWTVDAQQFEAIVVPGWLGRYVLIGPVHTSEQPLLPYVARWLDPKDYGLVGPRRSPSTPDDDIPF